MSTTPTVTSTLARNETNLQLRPMAGAHWAQLLPVETEIYILPDGRVVVADLPAELAPLLAALGITDASPTMAAPVSLGAPVQDGAHLSSSNE